MASSILRKILLLFQLPTNDKAKTAPSSQKGIDPNETDLVPDLPYHFPVGGCTQWGLRGAKGEDRWVVPEDTKNPKDTPPAYSDQVSDNTPEVFTIDAPKGNVEVCPHEILSFTRCQRILNLPNFRYNGAKIDAVTPDSEFHHRGHDKQAKECQDSCKPLGVIKESGFVGSLKGFGTYNYQPPNTTGFVGGLALSFHWEMKCLDPKKVKYKTTTELQAFLDTAGISLCSLRKLSDIDIVNAIHPIINRNGKPADPIDRYLAKEGIEDCEMCGTEIRVLYRKDGKQEGTCRVDTKRWLSGGDASDEQWRNQCAKPS